MLVIGGMGSVSGSFLGVLVVLALTEILRRVEEATLLYGLGGILLASFFLAVILFRREGILGQGEIDVDRLLAWRPRRRRGPGTADDAA